jgi:membrane protein implicated in regulation of membrane protease activity
MKRGWTGRIVLRYMLLQLPGLAFLVVLLILIRRWVALSAWFTGGVIALWILKDLILFPFVWRAYDWEAHERAHPMIGLRGYASDRLDPEGYIRVRGELWRAKLEKGAVAVEKGQPIRIQGVRGLTLIVRPE